MSTGASGMSKKNVDTSKSSWKALALAFGARFNSFLAVALRSLLKPQVNIKMENKTSNKHAEAYLTLVILVTKRLNMVCQNGSVLC